MITIAVNGKESILSTVHLMSGNTNYAQEGNSPIPKFKDSVIAERRALSLLRPKCYSIITNDLGAVFEYGDHSALNIRVRTVKYGYLQLQDILRRSVSGADSSILKAAVKAHKKSMRSFIGLLLDVIN